MTLLTLPRRHFTDISTVGEIFFPGEERSLCDSLEDTCRRDSDVDGILDFSEKVWGKTAIPCGRYEIRMEKSPKYGRVMPFLYGLRVGRAGDGRKNLFNDVMIHWGNKAEHSHGCILVGNYVPGVPDWVSSSRETFDRLFNRLSELAGPVYLEISGGLRAPEEAA